MVNDFRTLHFLSGVETFFFFFTYAPFGGARNQVIRLFCSRLRKIGYNCALCKQKEEAQETKEERKRRETEIRSDLSITLTRFKS